MSVTFVLGSKYVNATAFFRIMLESWNGSHPEVVKRLTVTALHEQAVHLCGPVPLDCAYRQELKHIPNRDEMLRYLGSIYPYYYQRAIAKKEAA